MKENLHPKYFKTTATCACGASFAIGSTNETIRVDICSKCHPLFTGTQKLLDTEGRVEKFKKKYEQAALRDHAVKEVSAKKKKEKEDHLKAEAEKQSKLSVMEKLEALRKGKKEEERPKAAEQPKAKELAAAPAKAKPAKKAKAAKPKKAPAKKPAKKKSK